MDRAHGLDIPRTLEEACDPRRLALLVYDMQVGILGQMPGSDAVVARVVAAREAARATGARVVYVRHVTLPTALMGAAQLRLWRTWQHRERAADVVAVFPPGSSGAAIVHALTPNEDEAAFDKITMSAFAGTPLDIVLRDCGVTTVAIAGVALEVGLEPTARHAADLGYVPVLLTDACGAGDAEAGTRSLAALAFAGDTIFATVDEFAAALSDR